jgi:predicted nucleic acid-binding protein
MIFVDTGVFYARLDEDDQNHPQAEQFFRGIGLTEPMVTSTAVVYETHALLLRMARTLASPVPLSPALRFLNQVELMAKVVLVTEADHQAGRALLE